VSGTDDVNGAAVSRGHSRQPRLLKVRTWKQRNDPTSMTTDNRRKEEKSEAKAEELRECLIPLPNGAVVDKAGKEESFLPGGQQSSNVSIECVVGDQNIRAALAAVKSNKGAPGVDGIAVGEIDEVMRKQWPTIKQKILEGTYCPLPVRRVHIPKPDGNGTRQLGVPTVMDRIIQQAIYQVIMPVFDLTFSEQSFGFRPGRSAHQAVLQAQRYIQEGYAWVVDIDLEKFFDRVNHDMLMARVARQVKDKKILLLIRRFLQAGVMEDGLVQATEEGTPQGGPLSPLLSNIILDDFDKELKKRGLRHVRYADDCNIYVKSERAGLRVMESAVKYITDRLKLKVNQEKSAVDNPWNRKFLGFTFTKGKEPGRIVVHESRVKRFKDKIRGLSKEMRGRNIRDSIQRLIMPITRGWVNYFGISEERNLFGTLDGWIRRRVREVLWRQWKKPRTRRKRLIELGLKEAEARKVAYSSKGPWRMARTHAMNRVLRNWVIEEMGYIPMAKIAGARSQ